MLQFRRTLQRVRRPTSRGGAVCPGLAAMGPSTMSQLHWRHCTDYRCTNVLHRSCAHWCLVLTLVMLLLIYWRCGTSFDATRRVHLWSTDNGLYDVSWLSSSLGSRFQSFVRCWSIQAWNQLPTSIRQMDSNAAFKSRLKLFFLWKRTVRLIKWLPLVNYNFRLLFLHYFLLFYVVLFCSASLSSIVSGAMWLTVIIVDATTLYTGCQK